MPFSYLRVCFRLPVSRQSLRSLERKLLRCPRVILMLGCAVAGGAVTSWGKASLDTPDAHEISKASRLLPTDALRAPEDTWQRAFQNIVAKMDKWLHLKDKSNGYSLLGFDGSTTSSFLHSITQGPLLMGGARTLTVFPVQLEITRDETGQGMRERGAADGSNSEALYHETRADDLRSQHALKLAAVAYQKAAEAYAAVEDDENAHRNYHMAACVWEEVAKAFESDENSRLAAVAYSQAVRMFERAHDLSRAILACGALADAQNRSALLFFAQNDSQRGVYYAQEAEKTYATLREMLHKKSTQGNGSIPEALAHRESALRFAAQGDHLSAARAHEAEAGAYRAADAYHLAALAYTAMAEAYARLQHSRQNTAFAYEEAGWAYAMAEEFQLARAAYLAAATAHQESAAAFLQLELPTLAKLAEESVLKAQEKAAVFLKS